MRQPSTVSPSRRKRGLGLEVLESRCLLDCHGLGEASVCVPGDSDGNGQFDSSDLITVLQAGRYATGQSADWQQGDWNRDGVFDRADVTAALRAATFGQGVILVDLTSLVAKLPARSDPFGPPVVIGGREQLASVIEDRAVRDAVAEATDFTRQQLLFFSWSGSGGDRLAGEARVVGGQVQLDFQFQFGLTRDLRPHQALFALPKDASWHVDILGRVIHEDTSAYQFVANASQLLVTGGFAGVHDEYQIEGSIRLTRNADGTASVSHTDAKLRGHGLSSLDGQTLDAVLNLSRLAGLQIGPSTVILAGPDPSGFAHIRLQLLLEDGSLMIRGGNRTPCCDFFQMEVNATAKESGL